MRLVKQKRTSKFVKQKSGTNLNPQDYSTLLGYMKGGQKTEAEMMRELVHEAIIARRLKEQGRSDADERYRQLQREALHSEIDPLRREINQLRTLLLHLKTLIESTYVKAGEATGISFECLHRVEGVYIMCEKNLTLPNLLDEGMSAQQIKDQLRINRDGFAGAMVEVAHSVQARSRRLLTHHHPAEMHKEHGKDSGKDE